MCNLTVDKSQISTNNSGASCTMSLTTKTSAGLSPLMYGRWMALISEITRSSRSVACSLVLFSRQPHTASHFSRA